jgi:hypothetical protein
MYTIILDEGIVLDSNNAVVAPCQSADDPKYISYIAWVHAGNTPLELATRNNVRPIPDVTPRQIRLALLQLGITDAIITAAINTMPSPTKDAALIAWEYSTAFQRNNQFVPFIGHILSYDSIQLDNLWLSAGTL